jgi:hypothetical protein
LIECGDRIGKIDDIIKMLLENIQTDIYSAVRRATNAKLNTTPIDGGPRVIFEMLENNTSLTD